jgi:hypothetical protein
VKEKPILFNAPMVRAILDGTKTQTRRIIKLPKNLKNGDLSSAFPDKAYGVTPCLHVPMPDGSIQRLRNPWGWPESEPIQLWVRETFTIESNFIEYIPEYLPPFNDGRPIKYLKDEYGDLTDYLWQQCHYKATDPTPELYYEDKEDSFCRWRAGQAVFSLKSLIFAWSVCKILARAMLKQKALLLVIILLKDLMNILLMNSIQCYGNQSAALAHGLKIHGCG